MDFSGFKKLLGNKKAQIEKCDKEESKAIIATKELYSPFLPSAPPIYTPYKPVEDEHNIEVDFALIIKMPNGENIKSLISVLPNLRHEYEGELFMWELMSTILSICIANLMKTKRDCSGVLRTVNEIKFARPLIFTPTCGSSPKKDGSMYRGGFAWLSPLGGRIRVDITCHYKLCRTMCQKLSSFETVESKNVLSQAIESQSN